MVFFEINFVNYSKFKNIMNLYDKKCIYKKKTDEFKKDTY